MNELTESKLEQIAQLIATLPSDSLLEKCQTEEQINEWHNLRNTQLLIADCWQAEFILCQGDPIGNALDRQEISKDKHDMIKQRVILYKHQWELMQEANKYVEQWHQFIDKRSIQSLIKNNLAKRFLPLGGDKALRDNFEPTYPFQSAFDLFTQTLKEEVDGSFAWCLEPYFEIPVKKWREATKQLRKNIEQVNADETYPQLKSTEVEKLKTNIRWDKLGFSWLGMTLFVCQFVALRDPSLRKKLMNFNRSLVDYCKIGVRASLKVGGFAWNKGKKVFASKAGGLYRS
ncbi:MAG: hypothetical protein KME19_14975 [Microcoleus vaginatus WJT46-NPBG5]|jgi:hypothetical protein|nr:hypothetical protein [Microcoleus vaginatus WJT46-NPBG5]